MRQSVSTRFIRSLLLAWLAVSACASPADRPAAEPAADATTPVNDARWADAPYVVVLSLDGFRHDYLDRYPSPALGRMAEEGARAERMIPTFPTKTFPTHYSIATGMYSEHHRLVGNRFWDPERGAAYGMGDRTIVEDGSWYGGEPIWVTAERQGMRSATYFFVGSEADVDGVRPAYWHRYDEGVTNAQRVDAVLEWLRMPVQERPHLILFYFSDLDDAGHGFGPDSPQVRDAVASVDVEIGRLLDGIAALPHADRVYVVVLSDHGMLASSADRAQGIDTSLFPGVSLAETGPYASLFVANGGPGRAAAVRDSLRAMLPEAQVWLREEVPERLHYSADPRIGDVLVLADGGATVVASDRMPTRDGFSHGWDNALTEMSAIFLIRGPGIARGQRVPPFESIHVYPLLAHLLGLRANPEADGRLEVLAPLLDAAR